MESPRVKQNRLFVVQETRISTVVNSTGRAGD